LFEEDRAIKLDERKNKTAPLATSKQGKAFRQNKAKGDSKNTKGKGIRTKFDDEEDEDDSEYSLYSDDEVTPPPRQRRRAPPPPPRPRPAPGPGLAPQQSATKRAAEYDDEALAWAMSRGTRLKRQKTAG
jgi:hypothetical protein